MDIRKITGNKKEYLDLLLIADEQESMIDRYLERGDMYVLDDGGIKAECVVTKEADGVMELKNIAVSPGFQRKGYGKRLIEFLFSAYPDCCVWLVGTGDVPSALNFYRSCGFSESHRIKNFFTDNVDHPMFEDGKQLVDMVYLKKAMLELRPLRDDDIPLVEVWLGKEHVKRWYDIPHMNVTIADWMSEIRQHDGEFRWITYLIAMYQGRPIGFCQYYKCEDSADEDFGTLPIKGSYGIDYLIGEESYLKKGLGKGIVALLARKIFTFADAERVTADIDPKNKASAGALLSCGFTLLDKSNNRYILPKE